jgi:16S rRNA (uracil1498-N3)-methyltransferase
MKRVRHAPLAEGAVALVGEARHYLGRVLRARIGERVVLFDGAGAEADATVVSFTEEALVLDVGPPRAGERTAEIVLLVGLLKSDKLEWVIQKTTELGVTRIVPVAARHSISRVEGERAAGKVARWRKIAEEAARQSRRADVPEIDEVTGFSEALALAPPGAWRVIFHEGERGQRLVPPVGVGAVCAAVGPEGGFADEEIAAAQAAGFHVAGLSRYVLRAETAAISAVAILAHCI